MRLIVYAGRPAAFVTRWQICLLEQIEVLERDHPIRRWVMCLAFFAQDLAAGHIHGDFTAFRAAHFARTALIPDEDFLAVGDLDDALLAELFNVPLDQVAEKRLDVAIRSPSTDPNRTWGN